MKTKHALKRRAPTKRQPVATDPITGLTEMQYLQLLPLLREMRSRDQTGTVDHPLEMPGPPRLQGECKTSAFAAVANGLNTERPPQVKIQCERLDHLTESLHHNLSKLEDKLAAVTRCIPAETSAATPESPLSLVPVAAAIDNAARGIDCAIARVQRLLEILEV